MVELHEPVSERIGKILRENREAQGLTRQQLSEKSTISDRQISAIELGEKGPSMNSLELLLRSLGLSADQIFYPELAEADACADHASGRILHRTAKANGHWFYPYASK